MNKKVKTKAKSKAKKKVAGKAPSRKSTAAPSPEIQLGAMTKRLSPAQRKLVDSARAALRKLFPTANELAYDYTRQIVIAYAPNDRGIDAVASIAAHADGVDLHLNNGPKLADPKKLLQGSGKMTRFVRLDSASRISDPDVQALIAAAAKLLKVPMPATGQGSLVIK